MAYKNLNITSKSKRLLSFLIDNLLIQSIFFTYLYYIENTTFWEYLDADLDIYNTLTTLLLSFLYGAVTYPLFSGNIGHKILGLKVIDLEKDKKFNKFYEGGCREFVKSIATILILPHLWIIFDKNNQNIYDRFLSTIVIDKKTVANKVYKK